MYLLCLPRIPGGAARAIAVAAVIAALFCFVPAFCGAQSEPDAASVNPPEQGEIPTLEEKALLARASSLEVLGQFLWKANLSASRARLRAEELRLVARALIGRAEVDLSDARTEEELREATKALEIVRGTRSILNEAADRLSATRGTRRKIRILALELSREALHVVRENGLPVSQDQSVSPGRLFKDNPPAASPRERALLREPERDFLTYKRGAINTRELVARHERRKPREIRPVPEEELYYSEGALTLSPLDRDYRSKRIWWSKPPEELAWKVEQW
jgi:hypothetical protein